MALPGPIFRRVCEQVDASAGHILGFLSRLVRFPTSTQNPADRQYPAAIRACHAFLSEALEGMGFTLDAWLARPMSFPEHPVLVGTLKGSGGGRSMALNGHVDVVPAGDEATWGQKPWGGEVVDGKLYGRGACDMKGGVAAMIQAVGVIRDCGLRLKGDAYVHIVSDEEVVGFGSRECAERAPRPDFVLVTEPTRLDVLPVEGGLEHVRVEIAGREEHAGRRYSSIYPRETDRGHGVNAVEKGLKIVQALQDLERNWALSKRHPLLPAGFNTLLPGIFIGGPGGGRDGQLNMITNPGTTPNYCAIEYNIWYYPQETLEEIQREVEGCVNALARYDPWLKAHPPRFTWGLRNISFPPANTDPDHAVVKGLLASLEGIGRPSKITGFNAASDLAWYAAQGIPGAIFGPGDLACAHSPDEFVPVSDVLDVTRAIALALLEWCGYEKA
jgi:acetylornithine deacetylase/succinyl-diaminopimelate desuccinylase family protein